MKRSFLFLLVCFIAGFANAQISVNKLVGKNSDKFGLGYGLFTFYDFYLDESETQSIHIDLIDFVFFPARGEKFFSSKSAAIGFLSARAGYKKVFSETKTGFYLLPSVGYCRVVNTEPGTEATYGEGIALAMEGGYSLEVGRKGNNFNFGLKFENDRAGSEYTISSIGARVSFAMHLLGKKNR